MREGIFSKLSMGVALISVVALTSATRVHADLDGAVTYTEPATTLVMPFDSTTDHQSFQIVSRIGQDTSNNSGGPNGDDFSVIATHWSFWSKDCDHLADIFICLTLKDTVVVDPSALQGQLQGAGGNQPLGPVINLTGKKGMVTVTAFQASSGSLTHDECAVDNTDTPLEDEIVGAWTIANTSSNAAFGNDAIGLSPSIYTGLPVASDFLFDRPFYVQTFNPASLKDSEVILISVEDSADSGNGEFKGNEIGPITGEGTGPGTKVCCEAAYIDNLEVRTSLPNVCWDCVGFAPVSKEGQTDDTQTPLIPDTSTATTSGLIELTNCEAVQPTSSGITGRQPFGGPDVTVNGVPVPLADQFLFAFHGEAVGSFGTVVKGKYTGGFF